MNSRIPEVLRMVLVSFILFILMTPVYMYIIILRNYIFSSNSTRISHPSQFLCDKLHKQVITTHYFEMVARFLIRLRNLKHVPCAQ